MPGKSPSNVECSFNGPHELLDDVNRKLLAELQRDPRLTMSELGRRVGMSAPAVTERVRRLEEAGIIRGYRLDLDATALGLPLMAFVRVRPNPGQLPRIAQLAQKMPDVVECHRITGEDCFLIKIQFARMSALDQILDQFLLLGTTTTSIVQSSPVPPRSVTVPRGDERGVD